MPPILPNHSQPPHRSHSRKPYAPRPHNDTGVSPTALTTASLAPPLCSLSARGASTAAGTSRPLSTSNGSGDQIFGEQPVLYGAPGDISGEPTCAPCLAPLIGTDAVALRHTRLTSPSNATGSVEARKYLAAQPALMTPQQQPGNSGHPGQLSHLYSPQPQQQNTAMFNHAHHFTATGTFIDVTYNNASSNDFMEKFLRETIPGAAYDSSARDPPPRCHPGTRLAILERCLAFISNRDGAKKMRWVVGAAGVGKSAIMQSVAEAPDLPVNYHASIFFSINGRHDIAKAIITISYQFAAKCEPYRQVIEREITRDPSLLQASMTRQFKKFIIEPFIYDPQRKSASRVVIIIDGLDECNDPRAQQKLLRLISDFCATYPSSPLVWLIASRPEPHITSFFSRAEVIPVYEKEEIQVDSNEARSDVEQFIRHELNEVKKGSDAFDPKWPEDRDIWKVASAAGGLFAYAQTVIRYVDDPRVGDPVSQLSDVLHVIDEHPLTDLSGEEHPMALLDALYARILSKIPSKATINARKLLLALALQWDLALKASGNFIVMCNWLGMTADEAYAALNHLRSALYVPPRDNAHHHHPWPFHKSFLDYVSDFTRSGFSSDIESEARQLTAQCAYRILQEAPSGVYQYIKDDGLHLRYGGWLSSSHTEDQISLTWSVGEASGWSDLRTRSQVYALAIGEIVGQIKRRNPILGSHLCVRTVTARFRGYNNYFPHDILRDWVLDEHQRSNFIASGVLKQVPLGTVDLAAVLDYRSVKLRFRGPATTAANVFYPWRMSCDHERTGEWVGGRNQDWITTFEYKDCTFCYHRFEHQLGTWMSHSPEHLILILFTSTNEHCAEIRYVDLVDGVSEWTYWFWFELKH